jgi:hypothetical protein
MNKTISSKFDKDVVWKKVRDRKSVVLDMNAWINMADDKFELAIRIRKALQKLVADGLIFCPLSFGLIFELYKQTEDSRLRVGALMEDLSLNISYANREEIFAWEITQTIRRLIDAGPIDLSQPAIYVPVVGYSASRFSLEFDEEWPDEDARAFFREAQQKMESLSLTGLLKMRARDGKDDIFHFAKGLAAPKYSEAAKRLWEQTKGDREKLERIEGETVFNEYVMPYLKKLPLAIKIRFTAYLEAVPKDKYGGCLATILGYLPSIRNHVEIMAAMDQNRMALPLVCV